MSHFACGHSLANNPTVSWGESRLFSGIEENTKNEIGEIVRKKTFGKDEAVFFYEDKASAIYIIESGKIKLCRETRDGIESVILIAGAGEVLGENLLFGENNYTYSAVALEKSVLYVISLPELRMIIKSSAAMSDNASRILLQHNSRLQQELEHIKVQTAPQRIGCFLLGNCTKTKGATNFVLPFEKGVIASKLGMKPETFSRALKNLKQHGVEIDNKEVIIKDIERLAAFTCVACSENLLHLA